MNRKEQYQRKLDFITEKIHNFPEVDGKIESSMDTLFNHIQISIKASMELIEMLSEDLDIKKGDLYSNLDEMLRLNMFSPELVKNIRQLNAMRFLLNNKFSNIQEELVEEQKKIVRKILNEFVLKVNEIRNQHLSHMK
ncbi:MAG: hypothetical protein GF317_18395 [Candidatus Lokiarchaeota archaeon]|nr:hypothetical protein [Candidatus Lokiarchaeota archaeon]MBD3201487.1 hypothetical protein [Candidatus Lokiarchaeota archaeon]